MDLIIFAFIVLFVLSVVGGIHRFISYKILSKSAAEEISEKFPTQSITSLKIMTGSNQDFVVLLNQLEIMMQQYNNGNLSDYQINEMNLLMRQTANQFHDMNSLAQQKYDTQVTGIIGYAASNGLNWNPY